MIPMIGSICQGSLGVCQLGRTWWKTLTRAVDLLDPAYPDNSGGLDTWCLQALELDVDEVYEYLRAELPDYVTFERWILEQKGGELPIAKVTRFNEIVRYRSAGRNLPAIVQGFRAIGVEWADNRVIAMLEDSKGKLWFGTGAGVSTFDGRKFSSYTRR
jgi:hypothetical protein